MTGAELLEAILAREEIPGALEIPVGVGPQSRAAPFQRALLGGLVGASAGFFLGALIPGMIVYTLGAGGAIGAAFPSVGRRLWERRPGRKRVLALTPDGCVVGFAFGVRAFTWSELSAFALVDAPLQGQTHPRVPHLEVRGEDGTPLGRIAASWFDGPMPVILATAEAYRLRAR